MFVDELQRDDGTFNDVIEKKEEDAKRDKGSLPGEVCGKGHGTGDEDNGRQGIPGRQERVRQFDIVNQRQPGTDGIQEERDVPDDNPWFREKPLGHREGTIFIPGQKP